MTIIQLTPWNNNLYGLGSDGKLYVWNPNIKDFVPAA